MSERRRWRLGQCFGPHPSHKRSNEMSDLIDRWRKGRAEFYTEDSMYSIGDKMATELEAVKAREEALTDDAVVRYVNATGGRTVHRLWRDTMRDQGRDTIYRDNWETLAVYDQVLDRAIALGLLMDFLGHVSAVTSGKLAASEPPGNRASHPVAEEGT